MSCVICEIRKEKRFCPAVHGRICPQCCGEQREVTLDCPSDCVYLEQARQHEKPRAIEDLDRAAWFPEVEIGQRFLHEHQEFIVGLSFALAKSVRADPSLTDSNLISALTAAAKQCETLVNSGLYYQRPVASLQEQAVAAALESMVKEYRETEQQHLGLTRLRDSDQLRALVFLVRMGHSRTSGRPKSRAFADFWRGQFPEKQKAAGSLLVSG